MDESRETGTAEHGFAISPVDALTFVAGRLVVLLRVIEETTRQDLANMDDLGSLDFFATHPLIVFEPGTGVHAELQRHGFAMTPEYLQPGAIHAGHLEMARPALALLLGKCCIEARLDKALSWVLTSQGSAISEQLTGESFAGHAFAASAILGLVPRQATRWRELRDSWLATTPRSTTM